jgi:predicted N-acetyltransferase YhbS
MKYLNKKSEGDPLNDKYRIRRAESSSDASELNTLFSQVFYPDDVGILAETMFYHLPGMENKNWLIVEEKATGAIVSACALIPWALEMEGVKLKVAEMGIVGTLEGHRKQGLMRLLNGEFDATLEEEEFDLAMIQGIPGFYHQFGYFYAAPLENDINLPLHIIREERDQGTYAFRRADERDIPFLMREDEAYRSNFALSAFRDEAHWHYLLTESLKTEYGSEFWIMEHEESGRAFCCRVPYHGFGTGLIVSEVSETITFDALGNLFAFFKRMAIERGKPYIRLNLHNDSIVGRTAILTGAKPGTPYAWQIKVPNPARFLTKIAPILERRIQKSSFEGFSGTFRLDFYRTAIDLVWKDGIVESVRPEEGESQYTLALNADFFPALCLGHRTWQELRYIRPDISPRSEGSSLFTETVFPSSKLWIYEQY